MFTLDVIASTAEAARRHGVEPAVLLAVVEVESAGRAFEADGATPRFLFERHVFHRELAARAPAKLARAVAEGLAIARWSRATQYRDQGSSAARLRLIARARALDAECANRSASWGVGQTMGFHARALGFAGATEMVAHMRAGGLAAQIDVMCRSITDMKLWGALEARDFAAFARRYNGAGYRANRYDSRMAAAHARWKGQLAGPPAAVPKPGATAAAAVATAGGAAAGAAQAGWQAATVVALALAAAVLAGTALWLIAAHRRRRAERALIPSIAR